MGKIGNIFKSILNACPYTQAGKKMVAFMNDNKHANKANDGKEIQLKKGMKMGRNIALVGFFCPIFWFSLLSGANQDTIIFNATHSAIVVALGLVVVLFNYINLVLHRNETLN